MNLSRIRYRLRQVGLVFRGGLTPSQLEEVKKQLSEELFMLFLKLQKSEQAHAFQMYDQLKAVHPEEQELLTAALLHDIGKIKMPLRLWERVSIVLGKKFVPKTAEKIGSASPKFWTRAFVVSTQHAAWGAEMVAHNCENELVVALIRRHQDVLPENEGNNENRLLALLQAADDQN